MALLGSRADQSGVHSTSALWSVRVVQGLQARQEATENHLLCLRFLGDISASMWAPPPLPDVPQGQAQGPALLPPAQQGIQPPAAWGPWWEPLWGSWEQPQECGHVDAHGLPLPSREGAFSFSPVPTLASSCPASLVCPPRLLPGTMS